ncbi:MAG: protein kinase [Gordonia sp. (in: high G+C Gram-positive bacteria)]|nr:protein kinase [Gordonia sp. (in: high G+C Gram-positive bacteria)]
MNEDSDFGPYRLGAVIGKGGMGQVYRAFDTARDREVALKLLKTELAEDETYKERFRRESQAVAKLGEPHIIPIHDYGEIDGVLFLDMRLVDGRDLRAGLRADGAMAPEDAVAIVEQVAAALDAAHSAGLVHRDVKPENVLVTSAGFAYLVDFGIAHHEGDAHLTRTGTAVGSIAYMAPEQLDNVPVGPASDVYSLAAVLFELLTARQPYPGDSVSAVVKATVLNAVPAPSSFSPNIPPALDAVVRRGLAKESSLRFGSAGELAAAARAALSGEPVDPAFNRTMVGPSLVKRQATQSQAPTEHISYSGPHSYPVQQVFTGPQGYPSGPVYAGQHGERDGKALNVVLAIIAGLMILTLGGLAVYWFGVRGSTPEAATSSTTTITSTLQAAESTTAMPPARSMACADGVGVGGGMTTCGFALTVREAYVSGGPTGQSRTVYATSPTTGMTYAMSCNPEQGIVICRGGVNAEVHIY